VKKLVEDMFETMYDAPGIGLAAIQVGVPKRIVTVDLSKKDEDKEQRVLINPQVMWSSEREKVHEEGACRSRNSTKTSSGRRRCG
jgi:peptide deformylase